METSPDAYQRALDELATLRSSQPDLTHREFDYPFTECASFADDIKGQYDFQSNWHFIDQPFLDQGGSLADFSFVADEHQIVAALTELTQFLVAASSDSFYVSEILKNFPDP